MPTPYFDLSKVPESEFDRALELIFARPEDYDVHAQVLYYKDLGLKVIRDPTTSRLRRYARVALEERKPLSAIRVSDGELGVLTFGAFDDTPNLDRFIAVDSLLKQSDSFVLDDTWLLVIRDLLLGAIAQADVVGVPGFWLEDGPTRAFRRSPEKMRASFREWPRGVYGDWKGRIYMPELARQGYLDGKVVGSNYFYLAFLSGLDELVSLASSVFLMTAHPNLEEAFRRRYPDKPLRSLRIGRRDDPRRRKSRTPYFLAEYHDALPRDLTGALCLVGGGPWSLIYCSWIRQRGGVALDIGSGADLLAGEITRSVHRRIGDDAHKYSLVDDTTEGTPEPSPA